MNIFYVKPKIAPSKGILNTTEKCPYCLMGFMDFMDIGRTLGQPKGVLLGCYACGGVFVTKVVCDSEKAGKRAMLEGQDVLLPVAMVYDNPKTITKCGKEMKDELSKTRHEKVCTKCRGIGESTPGTS